MKGLKSLSNGWLFGVSGRSVDPVLHGGPVLKRLRTGGSRRRNAMRDRSGPAVVVWSAPAVSANGASSMRTLSVDELNRMLNDARRAATGER